MKKRFVAMLACALAALLLLLPATAFAQDFTPNARLDDDGVLHWDAEGDYYSRIDLSLLFGPNSADHCMPSVDGEYTYDIENLFQAAEQFYGAIGTGDVSGLNGDHPVTFVYYEKQADGTMQEVGRAENAYSYSYTTGQLVQLATPSNLTWTGGGFIASWDAVANAAEYRVTFYETTADGSTSEVRSTTIADTSCELTSVVTVPKDGATYAFDVRAWGPEENYEYRASETSAKSAASAAWKTPVVEYGLSVGGVDVTSENAADVLGDNTVSYDPKTQTLKLNGANITGTSDSGAAIRRVTGEGPDSLTIELVGTNSCGSIVVSGNTDDLCPLTITGQGSLTVSKTAPAGAISVQGDITVDGAALTVNTDEAGIQSNLGNIIIQGGADVEANSTGNSAYFALWAGGGDVRVLGAGTTVNALTEDSGGYAVYGEDTVSVEGGATLTATGRCCGVSGISVTNGSTLDVTAVGDGFAVDAKGPITVTDSTLKAKSTDTVAVYIWNSPGALTLANSTVEASSEKSYALYAGSDGIEMSGGKVTLSTPASYATYTPGGLIAKDGVELNVTNSAHGLAANDTVRLSGATGTISVGNAALYSNSSDVVIESECDLKLVGQMTINAPWGDISISDSKLDVTGTDAVYAKQDITIDNSQIDITASENPINTGSGLLTISGNQTELTATGGSYCGAGNELVINGGDVSVTITTPAGQSFMAALYGNKAVRINGGTVNATVAKGDSSASTYAIRSNGEIEFTGGTTTLKGDTGTLYVSQNGGSVSFGSNSEWYQWATSPTGEVVLAEDDPYSYDEDKSTYLRIEPAVPLYELRVQGGTGSGMYAEGTKVTISAVEFDEHGHFTNWYVVDTGGGDFEDGHDATTIFTMPANDTNVVAGYEEHTFVHHDAKAPTCTEPGWEEYVTCEGCAYTTYKEIPAMGHTYEDGVCVDCGKEDPDYVAAEDPAEPSDGGSGPEGDGAIPATGDATMLAVGVPAALGAVALAAGAVVRRRR